MLKENPVAGFCANRVPPRLRVELVVVLVLVLGVTPPRPPKLKPPVPEAGVLKEQKGFTVVKCVNCKRCSVLGHYYYQF